MRTYVGQAYISSDDLVIPVNLYENKSVVQIPDNGIVEINNSRVRQQKLYHVFLFSLDSLQ